jgi:hypothetical protein
MFDDATFIAKETEKLADHGKDMILVVHSYGGVPITESAKGLGKQERQEARKKGGNCETCVYDCAGARCRDFSGWRASGCAEGPAD